MGSALPPDADGEAEPRHLGSARSWRAACGSPRCSSSGSSSATSSPSTPRPPRRAGGRVRRRGQRGDGLHRGRRRQAARAGRHVDLHAGRRVGRLRPRGRRPRPHRGSGLSPASGDPQGTGLFSLALVWNLVPYVPVTMLARATELSRRGHLVVRACVLTQAVAWTTYGLAPLVKQLLPGVAIGLFVLLSIPPAAGRSLTSWSPRVAGGLGAARRRGPQGGRRTDVPRVHPRARRRRPPAAHHPHRRPGALRGSGPSGGARGRRSPPRPPRRKWC